jgi:hypothetical protein
VRCFCSQVYLRFTVAVRGNTLDHRGSSYCSQSDLALTFGLGKDTSAQVEVEWPSGARQQFKDVPANGFLAIDEGRGITARSSAAK